MIRISPALLLRRARCSQTILVKPEASIRLISEVVTFTEVLRQHPIGSGGRSGSMLPPFKPRQRIHPHFNLISVNTSPSSSPVRF